MDTNGHEWEWKKVRSGLSLMPAANESGDAPEYRLSPHSTKLCGLRRGVLYPALFEFARIFQR